MSDSILTEVAVGLDQAKETVYKIMQKYYPRIRTSKSTLLNAFISGIAYIYSMFQVFAKLLQDELYVSTARELESLYKLIPFVGVTINQPVTMKLDASCKPQDEGITTDTEEPLYVALSDPFVDSNSYKFNQIYHQNSRKNVFDFSKRWSPGGPAVYVTTDSTQRLTISLGKLLGADFVPVSVSIPDGDILTVEFPYKDIAANAIRRGRIKFNLVSGSPLLFGSDNGSDVLADISLGSTISFCCFWPNTGLIIIALKPGRPVSFDDDDLEGLPVNADFQVRSIYRKAKTYTTEPVATFRPASSGIAAGFYSLYNIFSQKNVGANFIVLTSNIAHTTVLSIWQGIGFAGYTYPMPIDPYSVKITNTVNSAVIFDFADAAVLDDAFWGIIYRTYYTPDGGATKYYAYVLDEFAGIVFYEDPLATNPLLFTIDVTTKPNNKVIMEQYDTKIRAVAPPSEFNFDNNTFVLEDTDPILFDDLKFQITDPGYASLVFEQIFSLATVQGNTSKTYFEVRVLSTNKVEIKFSSEPDYTTIEHMLITYKTIKNLSTYVSGESMTGSAQLKDQDGTIYNYGGLSTFAFEATNISGQAGAAGIPTLESLRDLLEKAAYTLDRNVTRLNYESAIQTYFVGLGYDARIKVFAYEDFGNIYLDSVNGNVVFFVGLVNRYPNSDFILVVPIEQTPAAQYTRAELDADIPGAITDIDQGMINLAGKYSADVDNLQNAIRNDSCITNVLLSEGNGASAFIRMYAVYFKAQLKARDGFSFAEASNDVKIYLASLFKWSTMQFVRDINVSDVYREIDNLPSVDRILFSNFSHYKNNKADGQIKVHDILYKKKYTAITLATHPIDAVAAGNKYELRANTTGTITAATTGNKLTGANWAYLGFATDMHVDISGFVSSGAHNNGTGIRVVSADATNLVLDTADITLINETHSAKVVDSTNLSSIIQAGRRISVTGFSNPVNNVVNALVASAAKEYITMDSDEVTLAIENCLSVTFSDLLEVMENPLWDFSAAAEYRLIKIDVLGLGGVDLEPY